MARHILCFRITRKFVLSLSRRQTRDSLNDVMQLQELGPSPSNLCRLSLRTHAHTHRSTWSHAHTSVGNVSLSNTDSLCWVKKTGLFFWSCGGSIKFIFMGVYVLPKHIVVIYNRYSLVPSKTLNINVKRIYTNREKSQYR